ncbi:hypothetical protein FSP39_015312 [Pinctada imbricata]|uniref:Mutator-like transposase domain-containing protein n=1 Tax=Pinctada imbricata TaxID=66713 RepID=A0AA89CAX1_PINIB|nr:hypothetical protein FSP39_015312 [Pinctada imbricata]
METESNRILCLDKLYTMWNSIFKEHSQKYPNCEGFLVFDEDKEEIRGLACRERAKCLHCDYTSTMYTLYEEVEGPIRGRRAAKINVGLHTALSQISIGYISLRRLLLACNIPAPSESGLIYTANKILPTIKEENEHDMLQRCEQIKEINKNKGAANPNSIDVQVDSCYNNPFYSGIGNTPFQPATQVFTAVAEDVTNKHMIIGFNVENKLCSKGNHLKVTRQSDGSNFCCAGECGATIPMEANIGNEKAWSKSIFKSLKEQADIEVKGITTDPDSAAFKAAEELYREDVTSTEPEHFIDTRHFSQNHRKNVRRNAELMKCIPAPTKAQKTKLQSRLALDLVERCNKELAIAFQRYPDDVSAVKSKMTYVMDAICFCYTGYHKLCIDHSFMCKGKEKCWLDRSIYLPKDFQIERTTANVRTLRECCMYRLSGPAIEKTRKNRNTQKVEALNRVIRRSLPNNITFTRNAAYRAHSAVHSTNNGNADSLLILLKRLGCTISPNTKVHKALKKMQNHQNMMKERKKILIKYKIRRTQRRKFLYELYERHQEEQCYQKNIMMPSTSAKGESESRLDHSYFKKKFKK